MEDVLFLVGSKRFETPLRIGDLFLVGEEILLWNGVVGGENGIGLGEMLVIRVGWTLWLVTKN